MAEVKQTAEEFIGLDKLWIAQVTADDEDAYTVGEPEYFAPTAQLTKTTSAEVKNSYYDNGVYRVLTNEDSDELKILTPALDLATLAKITGKVIDTDSLALLDSGEPETVYFALMARALMSDYTYRYFCWHKVSFKVPDEDIATKKDSIDNKGQELTATAVRTIHQYSIGGKMKGIKRIVADERDGKIDASKWYEAVPLPGNMPLLASA